MKYFKFLALPLAILSMVACQKEDTSADDTATRVVLSPEPEAAYPSKAEVYPIAVVVAQGQTITDMSWEVALEQNVTWASVAKATVVNDFENLQTGDKVQTKNDGFELTLLANTEYKRNVKLTVTASDGTLAEYVITQLGDKADAAITTETKDLEYLAVGETKTVEYTTNMGDVYKYDIAYGEGGEDWLSIEDAGAGKLNVTAAAWTNRENTRSATLTITIGTDATSKAQVVIPVVQLAADEVYFLYGASADIAIENALRLNKVEDGVHALENPTLFLEGETSEILLNFGSRVKGYPYYALGADGKILEVAEGAAAPVCAPVVGTGLRRNIKLDFNTMTWSWSEVTVQNCLPTEKVAEYKTKQYIARDGSMKTWMVEWLRWDGGDIKPKLGMPAVPAAIGNGAPEEPVDLAKGGSGGYDKSVFPQSWDDWSKLNANYECTEIGGKLEGSNDKGRIYQFNEVVTGVACAGIGVDRYQDIADSWKVGATLTDAVGVTYTVESITKNSFTGDNAADEAAHPMLNIQAQGICPYGWHVANMADWLDLAYAASKASAGDKYPVAEADVTYKLTSNGGIPNFITWLKDTTNYPNSTCVADGANDFGFNMYPLGYRYMTQGWQNYGSRMQTFVPANYTDKQAWRFNAVIDRSNADVKLALANIDLGQAIFPIRCVKNYKVK